MAMVKRKTIRFSPVELALVSMISVLLLLNFWQEHLQRQQTRA
jgi:hypothetical protein